MKPIKFLKFWWEYNYKKLASKKIEDEPSFVWWICYIFFGIGLFFYIMFFGFGDFCRDVKKRNKEFWSEWKEQKKIIQ